ncbi:hypothetical protein AaE_011496 [Aphanomyces astaci]|uniref:Uncharacterized protein n=1 Tax=Aphanomyces astaci TaxID=112090 RepID=A0A6A4ZDT5_APHAT|nr:hypothetical protein AaE_011496 [Aphanomyces astaci]
MEPEQHGGFNVIAAPDKKTREHQAMELYQKARHRNGPWGHLHRRPRPRDRILQHGNVYTTQPRPLLSRSVLLHGNSLRAINEHESAIHDFDMAIDLDNTCASYYATRGTCHRKLGMPADALVDFTLAIELDVKKLYTGQPLL